MQEDYCLEDAAGLPEGTDFCVIAESDCMEPYIKRGERICVSRRQTPAEGEAGLFLYRGEVYIYNYRRERQQKKQKDQS